MMNNSFVIADPHLCVGCKACEVACVMAQTGKKLSRKEIMNGPYSPNLFVVKTEKFSVPIQCRQCEDAPCAASCPRGAIVQENGVVCVQEEKCVGCKNCLVACPIGAIYVGLNEEGKPKAKKCDLCSKSGREPHCVAKCPKKALRVVKPEDIAASITDKRRRAVNSVMGR